MKFPRASLALVLSTTVFLASVPDIYACGPSYIEPIFVFRESPDQPFENFIQGNIGILQPTFGRKTLFIAYRYLTGGSFTAEEQEALANALGARSPEDKSPDAIKAWVEARKKYALKEDKLPEIYTERQYGGYDFFPNCATNSFEVATETLKNRVTSYGAEDSSVQAWLKGQDLVFQNCAGGGEMPVEVGPESPEWLRKDREYQIAAAFFYSLNLDEALTRFQKIAADNESCWQQTADYLVARTLVRNASLTEDESRKRDLYNQAELHLRSRISSGGKFASASRRLLGLVQYRIHPKERVRELARVLSEQNGNENLRQDLIDYTWLLDKFEAQVLKEEEKRRKARTSDKQEEDSHSGTYRNEIYDAIQRGDLITIQFVPKQADGKPDFLNHVVLNVPPETPETNVFQSVEERLGRKTTDEEADQIKEAHRLALGQLSWLRAPNRKLIKSDGDYEGAYYTQEEVPLTLLPDFLRADDLSDWILTFQSDDPNSYAHAFSRWRDTGSPAWLAAAVTKAETTSAGIQRLLRAAENVSRDSPFFATAAYHRVRLKIGVGKFAEARKQLDDIISWQDSLLPISAQNQFLGQRMAMAENLEEFLKFAARRPVAFYNDGTIGKMSELLEHEKYFWNAEYSKQTKEEYEREIEERYKELLPLDDRASLDDQTFDILNWHFPLATLAAAVKNPALHENLKRHFVVAVWTRAVLINNDEVARRMAPDVLRFAPALTPIFKSYLEAPTARERQEAALFVLLKFPSLSPLFGNQRDPLITADDMNYYFQTAWWCTPADTEYDLKGNEVPKNVPPPRFLTSEALETARNERQALIKLGDGKSYLGKRVIEWAKASPADPRVPEALFIAVKANDQYKYGCDGWSYDQATRQEAEGILRKHYSDSPWTAKLSTPAF